MMNFLDAVTKLVFARVRTRRPRVIVGNRVVILEHSDKTRATYRLADMTSAFLSYRDVYAADVIVLTMGFPEGTFVEMAQGDPKWPDLTRELDRSQRIAMPSSEWQLRFMAAGRSAPPLNLLDL
jgi:hypothetical protein